MPQTILRTVVMYAVVIIAMRLMGKRQVGQLEPNELAIMILISELAALPMQDSSTPLHYGMAAIATVAALEITMSVAAIKHIRFRGWLGGHPAILIQNGKLQPKAINKSRLTVHEVIEELRIKGVTDLSTVQYAIMETKGQISLILYPEYQPVTAGQMGQNEESKGLPMIVLNDGRWLDKNLQKCGLTREFVQKELASRGAADTAQVYVALVDELNHVYMAAKG